MASEALYLAQYGVEYREKDSACLVSLVLLFYQVFRVMAYEVLFPLSSLSSSGIKKLSAGSS